ncbi:hypothetical protein OSB04_021701 [Centaurea solstitialis]|uniref:Uncharacterized protein n=1 Tax=Centaurea solstitialis TaxID=347529 RepID=A0AA38TEG9_9ASTR|nr:hypothetical protein OSB04_021701 [Centaurea solstitialis]
MAWELEQEKRMKYPLLFPDWQELRGRSFLEGGEKLERNFKEKAKRNWWLKAVQVRIGGCDCKTTLERLELNRHHPWRWCDGGAVVVWWRLAAITTGRLGNRQGAAVRGDMYIMHVRFMAHEDFKTEKCTGYLIIISRENDSSLVTNNESRDVVGDQDYVCVGKRGSAWTCTRVQMLYAARQGVDMWIRTELDTSHLGVARPSNGCRTAWSHGINTQWPPGCSPSDSNLGWLLHLPQALTGRLPHLLNAKPISSSMSTFASLALGDSTTTISKLWEPFRMSHLSRLHITFGVNKVWQFMHPTENQEDSKTNSSSMVYESCMILAQFFMPTLIPLSTL